MTGLHPKTARRAAIMAELVSLGQSRRRIAEATGLHYLTVVNTLRAAGIAAPYDRTGFWAGTITASKERAASMAALYRDGYTLEQIGQQYGITRERVRQLMTKHVGIRHSDGGQAVVAGRKRVQHDAARNARCLVKWGCSWPEYVAIRDMVKPTRAYASQMRNAARRGIGWELTLWQWWTIWQQSGHWPERGRGSGYVMCRKGDLGPYAVGNVFIATAAENSSEGQRFRRIDPDLPIGVRRTSAGNFTVHRAKRNLGTYPTIAMARAAYLRDQPIAGAIPASRVRRTDLPPGVSEAKGGGRYRAYFYDSGKQVHVGSFCTIDEAVAARAGAMLQPTARAA
jgi:DNA-binding CsgD family transcriptional regulator